MTRRKKECGCFVWHFFSFSSNGPTLTLSSLLWKFFYSFIFISFPWKWNNNNIFSNFSNPKLTASQHNFIFPFSLWSVIMSVLVVTAMDFAVLGFLIPSLWEIEVAFAASLFVILAYWFFTFRIADRHSDRSLSENSAGDSADDKVKVTFVFFIYYRVLYALFIPFQIHATRVKF